MVNADLTLLIDAARQAGEIALSYASGTPQVWDKAGGQGPVTEADLHVDRQLHADLTAARPDYGWLSEETEDSDARLGTERQFIIDPIDGTRAFIDGTKDWSHSLAIVEGGDVVAGVVYLPKRDALYAAAKGQGTTLNGEPIQTTGPKAMDAATLLASRPNYDTKHWKNGPPDAHRSSRSSLAYRLALVAEGRFDGMLALRRTWEWDVAAGALLVTEAGGVASTRTGDVPRFNTPTAQLNGLVAAGAIHQQLLDGLR